MSREASVSIDVEAIAARWTEAAPHYRDSDVLAASANDVPDLIAELVRLQGELVEAKSVEIRLLGAARVLLDARLVSPADVVMFPTSTYQEFLSAVAS